LHSLFAHYVREAAAGRVVPYGFQQQKVDVVIELAADGSIISLTPYTARERASTRVPTWPERAGNRIVPAFLCDTAPYVLGLGDDHRREDKHAGWIAYHRLLLADTDDASLVALLRWIDAWLPKRIAAFPAASNVGKQSTVAFQFGGRWLHEREAARRRWTTQAGDAQQIVCLVTGKRAGIAGLHPKVRGVRASVSQRPERAALVSYNETALDHYGRKGGENSPISAAAAHGYASIIEELIERGNRVFFGGCTHIFWSEASDAAAQDANELLLAILSERAGPERADEESRLKARLLAYVKGLRGSALEPEAAFYLVAIEPGKGRHSLRSFLRSTLGELHENIARHLTDLAIGHDPQPISVGELLKAVKATKKEIIPPPLARDFLRAVIMGERYPQSLVARAMSRVRVGKIDHSVMAIIKAYVNRNLGGNIAVSLNPDHPAVAYHLGRYLAAVDNIQRAANPKIAVTLRERHLNMLMARPALTFGLLEREAATQLRTVKSRKGHGLFVVMDRELTDIAKHLGDDIPRTLPLNDQYLVALGMRQQLDAYEHARQKRAARSAVGATGN
jgi:CRISPR-associated protein Csd1